MHKLGERSSQPLEVQVHVNETPLKMEVDTGAAVSIISEETGKTLFPNLKLQPSKLVLKTYTEEPMAVVGK